MRLLLGRDEGHILITFVIVNYDIDHILETAVESHIGELILNLLPDDLTKWPCTVLGIISLLGKSVGSPVRDASDNALVGKNGEYFLHHDIDDTV